MNYIPRVSSLFYHLIFISLCRGLYEDQIGKFDWRQQYVGELKFSFFDEFDGDKIYVGTEKNVLAALKTRTGSIIWRHVFEKRGQGVIHYMHAGPEILTISGVNPVYIRKWDSNSGVLTMESMIQLRHSDSADTTIWIAKNGVIHQILRESPSLLTINTYSLAGGALMSSRNISAPWLSSRSRCVTSGGLLACVHEKTLKVIDPCSEDSSFSSIPLTFAETWSDLNIESLGSKRSVVVIDGRGAGKAVLSLKDAQNNVLKPKTYAADTVVSVVSWEKDQHIILSGIHSEQKLQLSAVLLETGENVPQISSELQLPVSVGKVWIKGARCSFGRKLSCNLLLSSEEHSVMLFQISGDMVWSREEALSSIVSVEILELPVSDMEAVIENSFDSKEGALNKKQLFYRTKSDIGVSSGFIGMLWRRLSSQMLQMRALIMKALGVEDLLTDVHRTGPVRDGFGLHRMIVAASSAGKIFGIDNLSGEIIWQRRLGGSVIPLEDMATGTKRMPLFVLRTTSHFPLPAHCALLLREKDTGNGILFLFNPMTGQPMTEFGFDDDVVDGFLHLGYHVTQCSMLHYQATEETYFLKGLMILDTKNSAHFYPQWISSTLMEDAHQTFLYVANPTTGVISGFSFAKKVGQEAAMKKTWEIELPPNTQIITAVASKNPMERVNSQGRVLADRSVLYKYINPNLVAFVTQAVDKYILNIYLVDVVSGTIVFSLTHKRAKGPVHILHSENWVVYSYYNEKSRRTEVASLELYEGKVQSNSTAFSSVTAPLQPTMERQAFILPGVIEAMKETITEKGITSKHILISLSSGGILELPWMFVDPRRPIMAMSEMRDEGVIPYIPELPIPSDAIINYNKTVLRVSGIHTAPSGLESTCLVFVYGLDLFYTRVAPSKTFDLLKEDFDHFLITAVLLGLTVASYLTRKLSARKALKQAWK